MGDIEDKLKNLIKWEKEVREGDSLYSRNLKYLDDSTNPTYLSMKNKSLQNRYEEMNSVIEPMRKSKDELVGGMDEKIAEKFIIYLKKMWILI